MKETIRHLTLTEYQTHPAVSLSVEQRDALRKIAPSVTVTPSVGSEEYYDLTPASYIGVINLGALAIEIRPKIPIDRVLFLLSFALDPVRWEQTGFGFAEERSLVEAIIPGFITQVRRALQRGVLPGYRAEEAALLTIRGRIRFDDQIREHFGTFPPAEVRYDEFTADIDENRLIKAAIFRLGRMRIRSEAARKFRAFDSLLGNVQLVYYDPRVLPDINYTRLNAHYRPAIELAKLILRSASFELHHGKISASTFLVDMNDVFENFVVVALRDVLRLSERTFPQGAKGKSLSLDHARVVRVYPDLSWWDGENCSFVGDVKYKRVKVRGVKHPDFYQILAYSIAANLPGGLLIYAEGEGETKTHDVVHAKKRIEVMTLDVSGPPGNILSQVEVLANQIRRLRQRGLQLRIKTAA